MNHEPNEPQMSRYTAADLAKAREEGRRELLGWLRKNMTCDKTATRGKWGWGVTSSTYLIDADVFDALLTEKEEK